MPHGGGRVEYAIDRGRASVAEQAHAHVARFGLRPYQARHSVALELGERESILGTCRAGLGTDR